ncbi:hypothetical protein LQ567_21435 [Niabella pedocola]|uniref:DUF4468 domain-containing protein n=1 Tax=Niabella pedocola TaxID=1752077 RepID=A0ABS8PZJ5_9BACT|nr:hypothetical protein [Niabella pedocola]MCD2425361.1 hypothetical protein [Niabella pedocola]
MKWMLLLLLCVVASPLHAQLDTVYRNRVEGAIARIEERPELIKHVIKRNGVTYRYWLYKKRLFKIEKQWSDKTSDNHIIENEYQYYLHQGQLTRAYESEILLVNGNRNDVNVWSVTAYFKANRIVYIRSLGHGKTEDEDYDMEKEMISHFLELKTFLLRQLK